MARTFNGTTDYLGFQPRAWDTWNGYTIAAIARRNGTGNYHTFYYAGAIGGFIDGNLQFGVNNGNDLYVQGTSFAGTVPTTTALYAATKATGTVAPVAHYAALSGGTWVHSAMAAGQANPATTASACEEIGRWNGGANDLWNGDIEWLAIWNFAMSDNEVEALRFVEPWRIPFIYPGIQRFWWIDGHISDTLCDVGPWKADQIARSGTTSTAFVPTALQLRPARGAQLWRPSGAGVMTLP